MIWKERLEESVDRGEGRGECRERRGERRGKRRGERREELTWLSRQLCTQQSREAEHQLPCRKECIKRLMYIFMPRGERREEKKSGDGSNCGATWTPLHLAIVCQRLHLKARLEKAVTLYTLFVLLGNKTDWEWKSMQRVWKEFAAQKHCLDKCDWQHFNWQ